MGMGPPRIGPSLGRSHGGKTLMTVSVRGQITVYQRFIVAADKKGHFLLQALRRGGKYRRFLSPFCPFSYQFLVVTRMHLQTQRQI